MKNQEEMVLKKPIKRESVHLRISYRDKSRLKEIAEKRSESMSKVIRTWISQVSD